MCSRQQLQLLWNRDSEMFAKSVGLNLVKLPNVDLFLPRTKCSGIMLDKKLRYTKLSEKVHFDPVEYYDPWGS